MGAINGCGFCLVGSLFKVSIKTIYCIDKARFSFDLSFGTLDVCNFAVFVFLRFSGLPPLHIDVAIILDLWKNRCGFVVGLIILFNICTDKGFKEVLTVKPFSIICHYGDFTPDKQCY